MGQFTEKDYKEHRDKAVAARRALEEELISAGGEGVLLTKERSAVLALRPVDLLQRLRDGQLTAVTVLQAYQAKAIEAANVTNCVTQFIPNAKAKAEALDAKTFDKKPPLFGLPVSIKDSIDVEGMDSTYGVLKRANLPAEQDADIVKVIRELGAIPFVKTNCSQIVLTPGCSNPLWGVTVNPANAKRSSGGSSGGEGALIAGAGSVVGFGSDIACSVRLPSSWCGIYGLKPTAKRVSNRGVANVPEPVGIFGTLGILCQDAGMISEVSKAVLSSNFNAYDENIAPIPWNDAMYTSKTRLRLGVLESDALFPLTPGVKRAVQEAASAFQKLGHEVVPYTPPNMAAGVDVYIQLLLGDHGDVTTALLEGEIVDDELSWFTDFSTLKLENLEALKPKLKSLYGDLAAEHNIVKINSVSDLWKKMIERSKFCDAFIQAWKKENLDLLIFPVAPSPAVKLEQIGKITSALVYTVLFNLLDYPSMVVPVTRQNQTDEQNIDNCQTTDLIHEIMKENGKDALGLPLGVQLVALPYREELLCRAAREIADVVDYTLQR